MVAIPHILNMTDLLTVRTTLNSAIDQLNTNTGNIVAGAAATSFNGPDANFALFNGTDHSKIIRFDVSGITPATTRNFKFPDVNGTLALDTVFTALAKGLTPASPGGVATWLRADGTWAAPPGPPVFTSAAAGLAPASGGAVTAFLCADGTWKAPTASADVTDQLQVAMDAIAVLAGRIAALESKA